MHIQPYLFFNGQCEAALTFYREALAAEIMMLMRNSDSPEPHPPGVLPPGSEHKVMHASFRIGDTELMASDGLCKGDTKFEGISLSLTVADVAAADQAFAALSEGGKILQPLIQTFFSPRFGMVTDRFGVSWTVLAAV